MNLNFDQEIILENERVLIRPLSAGDFENLTAIAVQNKDLVQYSPTAIHTEPLLREHIDTALQERASHSRYPFIIFDKHFNEYAGSTSFGHISNNDKRLEIGWTWIGRKFQQTGLNRNCKFLMLDYTFTTLEFERVEFRTDERNMASRTAIEKIGAKFEGIFRSHTLMKDGFRRNTVCYSILKEEWKIL